MKQHFKILVLIAIVIFIVCSCNRRQGNPAPAEQPITPEIEKAMETLDYWDDDKDPERRLAAIRLGIFANPASVDRINSHLSGDRDPMVRAYCAWAAGQIADNKSLPILLTLVDDIDERIWQPAIFALARFSDASATEKLRTLASEEGGDKSLAAYQALGGISQNTPDALPQPLIRKKSDPARPKGARQIYVDATIGDDNNDGSMEKPLLTLTKAVTKLRAGRGDTIFATSGKDKMPFRERLHIQRPQSGYPGAPTVIRNWEGKPRPVILATEKQSLDDQLDPPFTFGIGGPVHIVFAVDKKGKATILDGVDALEKLDDGKFFWNASQQELIVMPPKGGFAKGTHLEVGLREDGIFVEHADYVHIIGFEVAYAQDTGIDFASSFHGLIQDVHVHNCDRHGIFLYYSPMGTVSDSQVENCRYQGISLRSSPHTVIQGCTSSENTHDGILFLFDSDGGVVADCTLIDNSRGVGFITGSKQGRVFSSTFKGNVSDVTFDDQSGGIYLPKGRP